MPGGDRAAREPWRMAVSYLRDSGGDPRWLSGPIQPRDIDAVRAMIERRVNSPLTSSAGRLFDAVAALIGLRTVASYEGQAAAELEGLAAGQAPDRAYPFAFDGPQINTRPLILMVVEDVKSGVPRHAIARRFHSTVVEVIAATCGRLRDETGVSVVTLGGGVFLNAIVLAESVERLHRDGFRVLRHRQVPPGDGGLCLGQLMVAAAAER